MAILASAGASAAPRPWLLIDVALAGAAVFFANAALLVLQLVAGRLLSPVIGVALETWTAIIGVILAGISLGNAAGGRLAQRAPAPRTLAWLLGTGGISVGACYALAKYLITSGLMGSVPLYPRIALATFSACFAPAFVLSLITPMAIQVALPDVRRTGRVVGVVYALGTLGSLAGTFLTGFVLNAYFSVDAIMLATAAGLVLLGLVAAGVARGAAASGQPAPAPQRDRAVTAVPSLGAREACAIVFVASFCSMALELTASRLLAPVVGVSLYSWTGIIGVVLAGIVFGNSIGGWLADRRPAPETLRASLLLAGMFTLGVLLAAAGLSALEWSQVPFIATIVIWSLALFFVPMLLLGTITPQVTRLAVTDQAGAGRLAGQIYAWSCGGAILGTFASGWWLIGALGMFGMVLALSALLVLLSLVVERVWRRPRNLAFALLLFGGAVAGLAFAGKLYSPYTMETNYYTIKVKHDATLHGEKCSTLALDHLLHSYVKPDDPSFLGYAHMQVQAEFVRAAAGGRDPRLLVIGGGGYALPRWAEAFEPGVHVDVVEIDPGVTEVVHRELGLRRDTKIATYNCDGRQFVQEQARPGSYALVVQDAVNDLSVPYHIMTKEYNDAVKRLLTSDGVYLLTVIDAYDEGELLRAALRTMRLSFKYVHLLAAAPTWQRQRPDEPVGQGVYIVFGSDQPLDRPALVKAVEARDQRGGHAGAVQTTVQPVELTEAYTARGEQIVLTDAYAPVDNLIAVVFRRRAGR